MDRQKAFQSDILFLYALSDQSNDYSQIVIIGIIGVNGVSTYLVWQPCICRYKERKQSEHRFEKLSRYYNSICGRSGKANFFHLMMSYYNDVVKKSYNFTKFLSNINFPHAIRIWTVILKTYAWMQAETIEVSDIQVICPRCTQVLGIRTQNWLCIAFLYFKMLAKDCMGTNNIVPPEIANRMHLVSAPLKSASLKSEQGCTGFSIWPDSELFNYPVSGWHRIVCFSKNMRKDTEKPLSIVIGTIFWRMSSLSCVGVS